MLHLLKRSQKSQNANQCVYVAVLEKGAIADCTMCPQKMMQSAEQIEESNKRELDTEIIDENYLQC